MQPEHQHDANYRIFMRLRGMASEGADRHTSALRDFLPLNTPIQPAHYGTSPAMAALADIKAFEQLPQTERRQAIRQFVEEMMQLE